MLLQVQTAVTPIQILTLIASILVPIIVGIIVYILNRNKDYAIKQSELVGKYYGNFWQVLNDGKYRIEYHSFVVYTENIIKLLSSEKTERYLGFTTTDYLNHLEEYKKQSHKYDLAVRESYRNFRIIMGSYRYFLPKEKKKELDEILVKVRSANNFISDIPYINCNSLNDIEQHHTSYKEKLIGIHSQYQVNHFNEFEAFMDNAHPI
jgi:hypothetical protein